jgi:ectoine hydroxylase-related dioxygenase (phytanoyl-CoA dioxygenase family)
MPAKWVHGRSISAYCNFKFTFYQRPVLLYLLMSVNPSGIGSNQLNEFRQQGYCILPQAVPAALLLQLRQLFDEVMQSNDTSSVGTNVVNGRSYTTTLDKIFNKGNLSCLELLGTPLILQTAATICGPDFFLIQEFAVIKTLGDTTPVLWHQDMLHGRTGQCFTMGIYLDDAAQNDGALRVIPQSHTSAKNICALQHEPSIEVPMKAGDILLHDMMLAHSSGIMQHNSIRRVLYFEFLSVSQVRNESIYSEELLHNRLRLLQLAISHYRNLHPNGEVFHWQNPIPEAVLPAGSFREDLEKICSINVGARPSAYCFEFQTVKPAENLL